MELRKLVKDMPLANSQIIFNSGVTKTSAVASPL